MDSTSKRQRTEDSYIETKSDEVSEQLPVTILSGFLGSGKTTLLQYILKSPEHQLRIAVIVNDMAELNVDSEIISRAVSGQIKEANKEVVKLQNGCICCTLRGDLIKAIASIRNQNEFDYIVIESTGIAEPQQVAESFCIDPEVLELTDDTTKMLNNSVRLDTCVSVVDVSNFHHHMKSLKRFNEVYEDGLESKEDPEGEKNISELMAEQVEFANVILLNKIDLVKEEQVEATKLIVQSLNPKAKILKCSFGKVDLGNILNTKLFNMTEASQTKDWLASMSSGVTIDEGEADEYGVTSFVYEARKPFHPWRLHTFLRRIFWFERDFYSNSSSTDSKEDLDNKFGTILRSKGRCWIAGRDAFEMNWAQSGSLIKLEPSIPWFCDMETEEWGNFIPEELFDATRALMISQEGLPFQYGDRRQEIVFIGTKLKKESLESDLDDCLLTDEEVKNHNTGLPIGIYPDPLGSYAVDCSEQGNFMAVIRPEQDVNIQMEEGFRLVLQNFCLNLTNTVENFQSVRIWLDSCSSTSNGILLAVLDTNVARQVSLTLDLYPVRDFSGDSLAQKLRAEPLGMSSFNCEAKKAIEVHIIGKVEKIITGIPAKIEA